MDLSVFLSSGWSISIGDWSSTASWVILISIILSGLGLFLFGMNHMSSALRNVAGDKLKILIQKTTGSPLKGILVGFIITAIIQSSSGTTVLVVGLVGAGLMTLPQAIGVIMGANIGTTITLLIRAIGGSGSIKISDYFVFGIIIGVFILFFARKRRMKEVAQAFIGFGILFLGLTLMSKGIDAIESQYETQAQELFSYLSNYPVLGFLSGTLFTALIQSSDGTILIIQNLYESGTIQLLGAIAVILGANVGTTITAVLSAIGGSAEAKRTAAVHAMFNIIGAFLFLCLLWPYYLLISAMESAWNLSPDYTIFFVHLIFNISVTFILVWFRNYLAKFACKMFKSKEDLNPIYRGLSDTSLIKKSSSLSLEFSSRCIKYMANTTVSYFKLAYNYSFDNIAGTIEKAAAYEDEINLLDKKIHNYLIKIVQENVDKKHSNTLAKYLDTIKDLERIGDHCSNIVEFFSQRYKERLLLSEEGKADLKIMFDALDKMVDKATNAIETWNKEEAAQVLTIEDSVDDMEELYRKRHVMRINNGECMISDLDYYVDVLSNLERIGDHSTNIANNVINDEYLESTITEHLKVKA